MIPIYDYIFYKTYKFILKTPSANMATWSTIFSMSLLGYFNILAIFIINLNIIFKDKAEIAIFFLGTVLLLFNVFVFMGFGRYKKIIEKYDKHSDRQQKIGGMLVLMYVLISLYFAF